jgi:hypothetical protein
MASQFQVEAIAVVTALIALRRPKDPKDGHEWGASQIAHRVIDIHRIGKTLHKLYEDDCNLDTSERREKREAQLEAKAQLLGTELGVILKIQGDPRGWPLIVLFPGEKDTGSAPRLGGRN